MSSLPAEPGDGQPRVPTIRKRYVKRAEYLKQDRLFLWSMKEAAEDWNAVQPAFAIRKRKFPPDDPDIPLPAPPAILEALEHPDLASGGAAAFAHTQWREMVLTLCLRWWPAEYYPNWLIPRQAYPPRTFTRVHPAMCFAASSVLWDPKFVPEEWIAPFALFPQGLPSDPFDPAYQPQVAAWKTSFEELINKLTTLLDSGVKLDADLLQELKAESLWAGAMAANELAERSDREEEHYWFVPLFPGMSSIDWRETETAVLDYMAQFDDLPERARQLAKEGRSQEFIARLFGVSRTAVQGWLKNGITE